MKLKLIAVGKHIPSWVEQGFNEYNKRLPHAYALNLIEISAGKRLKSTDINRLVVQEGKLMLSHLTPNDYVVALEVKGQAWDTPTLATQLKTWETHQTVCLLIGGPEGLATECLNRAQQRWSLSPLTLPHSLVRIIVAEQIYRAWTILTKHPYHR